MLCCNSMDSARELHHRGVPTTPDIDRTTSIYRNLCDK